MGYNLGMERKREMSEKTKGEKMQNTTLVCPVLGMGATLHGWSDSAPYEIVGMSASGKTITLRAMKADRDPAWTPETIPGGFFGHTTNNHTQTWILSSDPEGKILTGRMTTRGWNTKCGRVSLGEAKKFHDYNF